jgi:hypothetical protein
MKQRTNACAERSDVCVRARLCNDHACSLTSSKKKGTGNQSARPAGRLCDQKLIRVTLRATLIYDKTTKIHNPGDSILRNRNEILYVHYHPENFLRNNVF